MQHLTIPTDIEAIGIKGIANENGPFEEKILRNSRRWFLTALFPAFIGAGRVRTEVIAMTDIEHAIIGGASRLTFRIGSSEWEFIRILPGEFLMGSVVYDPDAQDSEKPPRLVRITRPFYLSKYQVTQGQYASVMMESRQSKIAGDDIPLHNLKYREALDFCRKMSSLIGFPATLPTEAQWEYACRAGTETIYYSGDHVEDLKRIAWFVDNSEGRLHSIGKKQPNAWGLYDMEGNVYEPCLDYISSANFSTDDPVGSRFPDYGIAKGGAWLTLARACRVSARILTNDRFGVGLRIAINAR